MADALRQARSGVSRGDYDEALVQLWNAVEPARLEGDRSALRTIEQLARHVGETGDEAQRREAERLVDAVAATVEHGAVGATARLDADVSPEGEQMAETLGTEDVEERRGFQVGSIVWLLIVLGIILVNVLDQLAD